MVNDVLSDLRDKMDKSIDAFRRDLAKVRTGRANLALLDGIRIEYYGTQSPLNQVASLQIADPRLIVIRPWEKTVCPAIEKTIRQADLGLNPSTDGEVVRVPIPPLTEERRKELVKLVKRQGEETKVTVRGHRRDANELLEELADEGEVSEDDTHTGQKKVQEVTDEFVAKVDELIAKKEREILEL